jgi:hypothetical protein
VINAKVSYTPYRTSPTDWLPNFWPTKWLIPFTNLQTCLHFTLISLSRDIEWYNYRSIRNCLEWNEYSQIEVLPQNSY